jgi:threonine-phosphate decarboxylase
MLKGHGGNLADIAQKFNVRPESLIDFSASVNSPIPMNTIRCWAVEAVERAGRYPDPEYRTLGRRLAEKYSLRETEILTGNGSSELLYLALRGFKPKRALVVEPGYADYADACRFAGAKVNRFYLSEPDGFRLDCERLQKEAARFDLVILGNPNNPTGGVVPSRELLKVISKNRSTIFIVDEAFIDFVPEESLLGSLKSNLLVLRSLTKFYGIPGLRIGFAAAKPAVIKRMSAIKEPWTVNCVAEHTAIKICDGVVDEAAERAKAERGMMKLYKGFSPISSLKVYPGSANFMLARITDRRITSSALQTELVKRGFIIRDCANFEGLSNRYFRVAVKRDADNRKLTDALKGVLG